MRAESTEESSTTTPETDETDPEAVRQAIRDRAADIKCRELRKAINQLETHGDLTSEQRQIITQMATTIVDEILAAPESTLRDASAYDENTVRTAVELFDANR